MVNTDACAGARAREPNARGAMNLRVVVATIICILRFRPS